MNTDPPFNPLLPSDFNLKSQTEPAGPQRQAGAGTSAHQENNGARRTTRPRRSRSGNNTSKNNWSRWNRIKGRLTATLFMIDQEKLKRVLIACGIAAGVALSIVLAVKLMPLAVTILALLGVAMALEVWNRLRRFQHPPF